MGFFSKIARGATQFGKTVTSPSFFNKVSNGISKGNNLVQKVGNFLKPIAMMAGQPEIVAGIDTVQGMSSKIANGLEKFKSANPVAIASQLAASSSPLIASIAPSVSSVDNNAINDALQFA